MQKKYEMSRRELERRLVSLAWLYLLQIELGSGILCPTTP